MKSHFLRSACLPLARLAVVLAFVLSARAASAQAPANCAGIQPGKYPVQIDSAPQGAAIYVGSKDCPAVGVTPWSGKLNNGNLTIIVEAPGYEPASKPFAVVRSRKVQQLFVPLVKKQDPPKIDVRADADKNMFGAQVFLDGQPVGVVPMVVTTTAGRHLLEIKKDGFEPLSQWLDTQMNQVQTLAPTIKEIAKPKYGTVVVDADVADAEVYIDGNKHPDNTPAVIANVIEGVHVIEVRKAPSLPWKQTVQVTANQQTKVRAELAATMNGGVGVVRVLSDAPGARAFIDGNDMGPVPVDIKDVKAGDHIVQVKAPTFQTGEKHAQVAAGSSQIMKFDLNPEAPTDQGTLKVVSPVPDAAVFIDGAAVGKTPQEKKLSAGEHFVVVKLDGYKPFEQKVRLEAAQAVTVSAELKAVGRLRILSTPARATVLVNGVPAGQTPLDAEVETGETVVRLELPGFQAFEQTVNIEGGKTETLSRELAVAGPSELALAAEQRGLSSFGARAIPRGRATIDLGAGYPYYLTARINVGAGKIAGQFPVDAGVIARTMFARSELGLGGRITLFDHSPFSLGAFTDIYYGSKIFDDSQRNGFTWDIGGIASLTALDFVTISFRVYGDIYSDRFCPTLDPTNTMNDGFSGTPIAVCQEYKDGTLNAADMARAEKLTGQSGASFYDRDSGGRLVTSLSAEIAVQQFWSFFAILEGAPFQSERALFTSMFSGSMFDTD